MYQRLTDIPIQATKCVSSPSALSSAHVMADRLDPLPIVEPRSPQPVYSLTTYGIISRRYRPCPLLQICLIAPGDCFNPQEKPPRIHNGATSYPPKETALQHYLKQEKGRKDTRREIGCSPLEEAGCELMFWCSEDGAFARG
jgi:hypothetical protein